MAGIKVEDIAFVRVGAPDLDAMEEFLVAFGLTRAARLPERLYMRGVGDAAFAHVTHLGDPGFAGVAFRAASVADLAILAEAERVPVEPLDGPGGGLIVKLHDPDGFQVEVVAGRTPAAALPVEPETPLNDAFAKPRENLLKRVGAGPSRVVRIGHVVLLASDFRRSEAWYKARFGFITSDGIRPAGATAATAAFMRCDCGVRPVDHHTLGLFPGAPAGMQHAAFEVLDFDDVMRGHVHLAGQARQHAWGIGRHYLGSQIFDYWRDPWGHTLEHWTDGDLLNAAWGSRESTPEIAGGTQWGPTTRSS